MEIFDAALQAMEDGREAVLLTICSRSGSAPRGISASMLVYSDGSQSGTIGGGSVEYEATCNARSLLNSDQESTVCTYRLHPNEAADLGMICGGTVTVLFERLLPTQARVSLYRGLLSARDAGMPAALLRVLHGEKIEGEGYWDGTGMHGVTCKLPEGAHDRAAFSDDGSVLYEPVRLGARAIIFGGGHVSQKLVPVLAYVSFRCIVCEDRAAFADPALFPAAEQTLLGDFSDLSSFVSLKSNDYAVVMTRGHQADYEILRQLLKTDAAYIGCIGSRAKIAATRQRLLDDGYTEADFARIHTPIGLSIRAETPEEIAISVAAEMILCRAERA